MLVIQRPTVEPLGEAEGNRQRFCHQPARARLRSHARQLPAPHAAVVDPRRGRHPGPLRRRPPRVRHHHGRHRGRHRHHPQPEGPRARSCTPTSPSRCASTPGARPRSPPATSSRTPTSTSSTRTSTSPPSTPRAAWRIDITVARGRGYVSADRNKVSTTIGVIPVDSIFSPVRRVAFEVEPTRVEQDTNYDRLVLDIETDGSISPREALASAGATLRSLVQLVEEMSDEPQGLELGEVGAGDRRLARPRPADRGPRPVRAAPQLPEAGADQHDRRAAPEDRGRPAGHHQLRPEVARRGDRQARRARAVAAHPKD